MSIIKTVDVRIVTSRELGEEFVASMDEWLRRDGFKLAKQPAYYPSRKDQDDMRIYTVLVKED
ncbi:MAG: hypothetical protein QNJ68_02830 [Microcoleaceae cyanobacterium MO_207.B10]|nr:hypothetical protein [Microcoleaceae cyanobacterium MO_207.B10]